MSDSSSSTDIFNTSLPASLTCGDGIGNFSTAPAVHWYKNGDKMNTSSLVIQVDGVDTDVLGVYQCFLAGTTAPAVSQYRILPYGVCVCVCMCVCVCVCVCVLLMSCFVVIAQDGLILHTLSHMLHSPQHQHRSQ